MSTTVNTSGLTPDQSQALKERSPQPHEESILKGIREMYSCKPQPTTFDIYAPTGVFHDPVGIAEGTASIKNQFVALTKMFPRADLPKFRVLENPPSLPSSTILVDQDVAYFRDENGAKPTITVNSLLTLETDNQHKVTKHTEEWNHKKTTSSEDGFFGMINENRKRFTVAVTDKFMSK